jgi:hypothetical protein
MLIKPFDQLALLQNGYEIGLEIPDPLNESSRNRVFASA